MEEWDDGNMGEADEEAASVIVRVKAGDWCEKGKVPRFDPIARAVFGEGLLTDDASSEDEEEST